MIDLLGPKAPTRSSLPVSMLCLFILLCIAFPGTSFGSIHHRLDVRFHVPSGEIFVTDELDLSGASVFSLSEDLEVTVEGGKLIRMHETIPGVVDYRIEPASDRPVLLSYSGRISGEGEDIFGMPSAVVDEKGIFLDASSAWYPLFRDPAVTFEMNVTLPESWELVPQGVLQRQSPGRFRVEASDPQEDIYLVAGPFRVYSGTERGRPVSVFLLQPDDDLAARYLDVIDGYISFYETLIGPYPHDGFAVVENHWQTGYGMPGFTLLGSRVLRLPFMLKTSLPHEILHNWFGNGVYIDPSEGNWSEGLTAYLADYLIKEAAGEGARYRQRSLARYTDFASEGRDMPVSEFRSRHDDASQSVGYDKVLLAMHMLRHQVGDQAFVEGLQRFFAANRFRRAGYMALLRSFEAENWDPSAFYDSWLSRAGAPELAIDEVAVTKIDNGYQLQLAISQVQNEAPFPIQVPVFVTLEGEDQARPFRIDMSGREAAVLYEFDRRPLRVDVDPAFDLFRKLAALERPSTLARLFGANRQWLVIPADAPDELKSAWQELAQAWNLRYRNVEVVDDRAFPDAGPDDAVWLLGWNNALLPERRERFGGQNQRLDENAAMVDDSIYGSGDHAVVLVDPDNARMPMGFVGATDVTAIRRLASKLTHYGSYGQLVFSHPGLESRIRGRLGISQSPLSYSLEETPIPLRLPPEVKLVDQIDVSLPR